MAIKTPIRWYGGKKYLLSTLLKILPKHLCFVEVFGGSGALFFAKSISQVEVYNDINSDLVSFFRVLRDKKKTKKLQELLRCTPYSREEYFNCKNTFDKEEDEIEKARQFFVLTKQSFNSIFATGWTASAMRNDAITFRNSVESFQEVSERLRRVNIENKDFSEILNSYDRKSTFFYLDPPYIHETRTAKKKYQFEMTTEQHESMLKLIVVLKGKVLLSGYDNRLYNDYLKNWTKLQKEVFCNSSPMTLKTGKDIKRPKRTEVMWVNYKLDDSLKSSELNDLFCNGKKI